MKKQNAEVPDRPAKYPETVVEHYERLLPPGVFERMHVNAHVGELKGASFVPGIGRICVCDHCQTLISASGCCDGVMLCSRCEERRTDRMVAQVAQGVTSDPSGLPAMQAAVGAWTDRNFPCDDASRTVLRCALGVAEEAGELCHAVLKRDQGIRGSAEQHQAAAKDAVGDIIVYLMHLCHTEGWSLETIIAETVAKVTKRDWHKDPKAGGETE